MLYAAADGSELVDKMPKEHWAAPYYYAALADGYFDGDSIEIGLIEKEIPRKHMAHMVAGAVDVYKRQPYGAVEMEVLTNYFKKNLDSEGKGTIDIDYNISLKGLAESRSTLNIEVM